MNTRNLLSLLLLLLVLTTSLLCHCTASSRCNFGNRRYWKHCKRNQMRKQIVPEELAQLNQEKRSGSDHKPSMDAIAFLKEFFEDKY